MIALLLRPEHVAPETKPAIDLDLVQREGFDVAEQELARPEIVEREPQRRSSDNSSMKAAVAWVVLDEQASVNFPVPAARGRAPLAQGR